MDENTLFRILYSVTFLSVIVIVAIYRRRAEPEGGRVSPREARAQEGTLIYVLLRLGGLLLWLGGLAAIIYPPVLGWAALPLPGWARWLGVGIAAALPALVIWAQRSLAGNVTKTVVTKAGHSLVTSGPYRWIRHPLYTFGVLFFVALSLISATWYFAGVMALASPALILRTRKEEAMLVERFGDEYRAYMQRTGRFLPRLFG